jgi:4-hydroxybenzoate polyprenyltransferase
VGLKRCTRALCVLAVLFFAGAFVLDDMAVLLAGALILLVVVSAYASARFRWPVALVLAGGLTVGSSIIFVWLLGLPIPIIGTWFGG